MENKMDENFISELIANAIEKVGDPKPRREYKRYSKEFFVAIEKMWEMGYTCTQIGAGLGIKRHSVGSYLKLKGLYKPQNYNNNQRDKLVKAREVNPY